KFHVLLDAIRGKRVIAATSRAILFLKAGYPVHVVEATVHVVLVDPIQRAPSAPQAIREIGAALLAFGCHFRFPFHGVDHWCLSCPGKLASSPPANLNRCARFTIRLLISSRCSVFVEASSARCASTSAFFKCSRSCALSLACI